MLILTLFPEEYQGYIDDNGDIHKYNRPAEIQPDNYDNNSEQKLNRFKK